MNTRGSALRQPEKRGQDQARWCLPCGAAYKCDSDLLSGLFDLSPAEARLVQKLAQGLTIGEVGNELDLSVTTLRTQLRSVFANTGISRQIDLSRLVGSLGAVSPRKTTQERT